jgi:lactate permease
MIRCMCSWRQTREVWPALLVSGGSFAAFQLVFATCHKYVPSLVLYPMTDIGGGIFSLVVTALFLRFWQPRTEFRFNISDTKKSSPLPPPDSLDAHAEEARKAFASATPPPGGQPPLDAWSVTVAWTPFAIMSLLLLLTGPLRQLEENGPVHIGPLQTNYKIPVPFLHNATHRDPALHPVKVEQAAALLLAGAGPLASAADAVLAPELAPKPEKAEYNFAWLSTPGTPVFVAAVLSMLMLRMNRRQVLSVLERTMFQMKVPIPTIAFMLGLSYVTRYAGMDATLGVAFAGTGLLYPFFAALLGWLGVFLTGTDAGSNALFGSLQKITATAIYPGYHAAFPELLGQDQLQILICTVNSTGGVMGKMIDAQSIVVATAATDQLGREADIFKAVLWHSIFLACAVGVLCLLQAYVPPLTELVPSLPGR